MTEPKTRVLSGVVAQLYSQFITIVIQLASLPIFLTRWEAQERRDAVNCRRCARLSAWRERDPSSRHCMDAHDAQTAPIPEAYINYRETRFAICEM
jgi:hypothetical protein